MRSAFLLAAAAVLVAASPSALEARGGPVRIQPVAGADPYVAVPGGQAVAGNAHPYNVVFEARRGPDKPDQLTPAVNMAGSELNTLAAHGVLRSNVHFVLVFHTTASNDAVLDNAHYRAKHGVDNPNLPVLAALRAQGAQIYVCGQSLLADGVALSSVDRLVTIAEDGVVVLMDYGSRGYAQLVF